MTTQVARRVDQAEVLRHFRHTTWLNMRRELEKTHGTAAEDLREPEWDGPGEAYFWHQSIRKRIEGEGQDRHWEDSKGEWTRVGPLRCENPAQVAGYLERGLRFRPPGWSSNDELESVDDASEPSLAAPAPSRTFECSHGKNDVRRFATWKGYLRHCERYEELPREEIPDEVKAHAKKYEWFCFIHGSGFQPHQQRQMEQHMRGHKIRTAVHPPLYHSPNESKPKAGAVTSGRGPVNRSAR